MRYKLENGLDQFGFHDSQIISWKLRENMQIEIAAPVAKADNRMNESLEARYIDTLQLHLLNAHIQEILLEGYKRYDANDVLQEEVPDRVIASLEYAKIIQTCVEAQGYIYEVEQLEQKEGEYCYRFFVDVENDTYLITVVFSKSIAEWDCFQNKIMY